MKQEMHSFSVAGILLLQVPILIILLSLVPNCSTEAGDVYSISIDQEFKIIERLFFSNETLARSLKMVRPPGLAADNGTLMVTIEYQSVSITDLDEKTGYITITAWETLSWRDPRLKWNASEYNKAYLIKIATQYIWIPDVTHLAVGPAVAMGKEEHPDYGLKAAIAASGHVIYVPKRTFIFHCNLDLTYFPFDNQTCMVNVSSWVHVQNEVNFTHTHYDVEAAYRNRHSGWTVLSSYLNSSIKTYACCNNIAWQTLTLTISISRVPWFYYYMFVVPSSAIMFVLPIIHLFPSPSSQKTTLTGILLLSCLILHLMLYEQVGGFDEDKAPLLLRTYNTRLIMIVISVAVSSITASLTNVTQSSLRLPKVVRKILDGVVGRICCFGTPDVIGEFVQLKEQPFSFGVANTKDTTPIVNEMVEENANQQSTETSLDKLTAELRYVREKRQLQREWYQLALMIDRLAFVVFLLYAIIAAALN